MRLPLLAAGFLFPLTATAANISIAVMHQPPYMDEETRSGMFIDIITEALQTAGHTAKPVFLPARRGVATFEDKEIDGLLFYVGDKGQGSCRTESYGDYQPSLIALKRSGYAIKSFEDMTGRRVGAFLGAKEYFAPFYPDYVRALAKTADYREDDIVRITKLMLNGRMDIGVMDWRIFLWTAKADSQGNQFTLPDFEQYPVFQTAWVGAQFWKSEHCQDFDRGLAAIKANGRYEAIRKKYNDALLGNSKP